MIKLKRSWTYRHHITRHWRSRQTLNWMKNIHYHPTARKMKDLTMRSISSKINNKATKKKTIFTSNHPRVKLAKSSSAIETTWHHCSYKMRISSWKLLWKSTNTNWRKLRRNLRKSAPSSRKCLHFKMISARSRSPQRKERSSSNSKMVLTKTLEQRIAFSKPK